MPDPTGTLSTDRHQGRCLLIGVVLVHMLRIFPSDGVRRLCPSRSMPDKSRGGKFVIFRTLGGHWRLPPAESE
ncbi:hypothetical protein C4K23_2338 [Pseudomonas chlororaphis]|nr:hypothetical protein C4K23_2338 [Pseudomonas chlororaphis]